MRVILIALLFLPFSGCIGDIWDDLNRPDYSVARTALDEGEWNRVNQFQVVVEEPTAKEVRIVAKNGNGEVLEENGVSAENLDPVGITLPDGDWTITYHVDGYEWETLRNLRIDTTEPEPEGLERIGDAVNGNYVIGEGITVEENVDIQLLDAFSGELIATELPYIVTNLDDGLHAYRLLLLDPAGNPFNATIQVRVGDASVLPEGSFSFGVVARYTNELQIWDLRDLGRYASIPQAQIEAGAFLGEGYQITPNNPDIERVVDEVVSSDMNSAQAAMALYRWMFDELEYDDSRLTADDLLAPSATIERGGGVCRDLAAVYVSLLRSAGIPSRVVSGYLAGGIGDFHAWVEFYGGSIDGQDAWIPVDVSPIRGSYEENVMLQAFGIRLPDYLPLRELPEAAEVEGWSTVLGVNYRYPTIGGEPDIDLEKQLTTTFVDRDTLCIDPETLARGTAQSPAGCAGQGFSHFLDDFITRMEQTIDYGIQVQQASAGTEIEAEIAYPFEVAAEPGELTFLVYGEGAWDYDEVRGKVISTWDV